jgi:DNA-3-methyladenine glycosylase
MDRTFDVLPPSFFEDETLAVARWLLGQRLVRRIGADTLTGFIVETEAYGGAEDSTSHAFRGVGGRAAGMFGPVGRAYVYLIYGLHSCLNIVAHPPGGVGAVLIRALVPEHGVERMREHHPKATARTLASGPGRLSMALAIDRRLNNLDLCDANSPLFCAWGEEVADDMVVATSRVGVRGRAEDIARPWRLVVEGYALGSGNTSKEPSPNNT